MIDKTLLNKPMSNKQYREYLKKLKSEHKKCTNYEDGCEEWAGCPCINYKTTN